MESKANKQTKRHVICAYQNACKPAFLDMIKVIAVHVNMLGLYVYAMLYYAVLCYVKQKKAL